MISCSHKPYTCFQNWHVSQEHVLKSRTIAAACALKNGRSGQHFDPNRKKWSSPTMGGSTCFDLRNYLRTSILPRLFKALNHNTSHQLKCSCHKTGSHFQNSPGISDPKIWGLLGILPKVGLFDACHPKSGLVSHHRNSL